MTSNGVASLSAQAAPSVQHERAAEQLASHRNDDVQERSEEKTPPVTEPEQIPAQVYNARGKLVPPPALSSVDLSM